MNVIARRSAPLWAALGLALLALAACGEPREAPAASEAASDEAMASRLAKVGERLEQVRDVRDIQRLQRAYGYYLDQGQWDEAANLFAEDGTIEIGLDGVYVGRERVRAYLYTMGGGRSGLAVGRLNEHLQVMPVITLESGLLVGTAQARWREILMEGIYGEAALWGEGPMENTYVKENGVWKIKSLHWYESMLVPYEGGWRTNADPTGGKQVSEMLPADRPPSVEYGTWPEVYLPPFHFPNPVTSPPRSRSMLLTIERDDAKLPRMAAVLAQEVAVEEAQSEVENLQRTWGYYVDEALWSEAASLFAREGTIELGNQGVYVGPERILAFLRTLGPEGLVDGRLYDHMLLQPMVHVAPDAKSAKARWKLFSQVAEHGKFAEWGTGAYECEYVLEDGVWKIAKLRLYPRMTTPYEVGWAVMAKPSPGVSETLPPDRPPTADVATYPASFVAPYHYDNPVLGRPVYFESPADYAEAPSGEVDEAQLAETIAALEERVTRLEDRQALENLNAIYGYYLASNSWDDLAGIFADDGTIEIALRGVYVGKESVRRNLDLYGTPGSKDGLLHNHMQFQPVIHVAPDGSRAYMRSRALSIMGEYERYGQWMGGVYENTFVKEEGIWKLETDRVINTYFAPYDVGWRDLTPRQPPGITESNPPDLPPTSPFEMYPKAFLVPFHYPNPVTGREVVAP